MSLTIPDVVNDWGMLFADGDGQLLLDAIPLSRDHPDNETLQEAIQQASPDELESEGLKRNLSDVPDEGREAFAAFLAAYFAWVRDDEDALLDEEDEAFADFTALATTYTELNRTLASSTSSSTSQSTYPYAHLYPLIVAMARKLMEATEFACALSSAAPRELNSPRSIQDSTRLVLERTLNLTSVAWDGSATASAEAREQHVTGDCLWAISNLLWRIYAQRNLHNQANELRRTFASLNPSEERRIQLRGDTIPALEVSEAWYWRGRLSCVLMDFRTARRELEKAYEAATEDYSTVAQRRTILALLIPVNLLLGRLTPRSILDAYNLQIYIPLIQAFRMGDIARWRQLLEQPYTRDWLRRRNVWVMLYERGEILVWRNLFRRAVKVHYTLNPTWTLKGAPTGIFLTATRTALAADPDEGEVGLEDVICILSSLIDQGLILGYLSYTQQTLAMKVSNDGTTFGAFPRLVDVKPRVIHANT